MVVTFVAFSLEESFRGSRRRRTRLALDYDVVLKSGVMPGFRTCPGTEFIVMSHAG